MTEWNRLFAGRLIGGALGLVVWWVFLIPALADANLLVQLGAPFALFIVGMVVGEQVTKR